MSQETAIAVACVSVFVLVVIAMLRWIARQD